MNPLNEIFTVYMQISAIKYNVDQKIMKKYEKL
jgi:hypothetical protein